MKLTVVGCAGSYPRPDSAASCYLVEHEDTKILLDLGSGALGPLQMHTDLRDIDAVLLSHLHPDHFADMCGFYVTRRYGPGPVPARIPVYGPSDSAPRLAQAYGMEPHASMADVFDIEAFPGEPVTIGAFTITTERVNHPVEAYAIRVSAGGASVAYSGDTAACEGLVTAARGVDLALFEASFCEGGDNPPDLHMTAGDAARMAVEAGAGRLMLTHQVNWHDNSGALAETAAFQGEVLTAKAGLVVEI